jgi:hypothetical protein
METTSQSDQLTHSLFVSPESLPVIWSERVTLSVVHSSPFARPDDGGRSGGASHNFLPGSNQRFPSMTAQLSDVNMSGMRLHVDSRIPLGAVVEVQHEHLIARGIVWQCRKFKDTFSIGIEFDRLSGKQRKGAPVC